MKILNAHAQAVEAQAPQGFQMRCGRHARVDLDADFGVRRERESLGRESKQAFHLFGRQIGGRAAAPVKLHDGAFARNEAADVLDFALQYFDVRRRDAVILGDHHVAGAEQAQAFTERKVHVERYRSARRIGGGVVALQIVRAEIILPDRSRRIARVARPGPIVFLQKLFGDLEAFPVQLQMKA